MANHSNRSGLREYKDLPVWIVEGHNDVLPHIYRGIGSRHLPMEGITLVHFDSHPDLCIPIDMSAADVFEKDKLFSTLGIENWILPAAYAGHFSTIVWIKPPWSNQFDDGEYIFQIGKNKHSGKLRVTCSEDYFLSDTLWAPECDLDHDTDNPIYNPKTVTFRVVTLVPESFRGTAFQKVKDNPDSDSGTISDKSTSESSSQYSGKFASFDEVRRILEEAVGKGKAVLLDVDLDFFSTKNPFKDVYSQRQMELLEDLYRYERPSDNTLKCLKECTKKRCQQLEALEKILRELSSGKEFSQEELNDNPSLVKFLDLINDVKSSGGTKDIDYDLLHQAGMTCDDNDELPSHISNQDEIRALMVATETMLSGLPKPTMVTIARSSYDDYCPKEQVELIQHSVLKILQTLYGKTDVQIDYWEYLDETDDDAIGDEKELQKDDSSVE